MVSRNIRTRNAISTRKIRRIKKKTIEELEVNKSHQNLEILEERKVRGY